MNEKIKVNFIYHSGFMVETDLCTLVFDYYKGDLPVVNKEKPIYVFASHRHRDHFNPHIFQWAKAYQAEYFLSDDITKSNVSGVSITYLAPDQKLELPEKKLKIETLKSTDEGVAFLVTVGDICIYHAGDLNWWHWEGEGDVYNEQMAAAYKKEIDKIEGRHFDLAFVPVDPRLGEAFYYGIDYFMKHTETDFVYPIHCWEDKTVGDKLKNLASSAKYSNKICF